jgi:hypothetical protein
LAVEMAESNDWFDQCLIKVWIGDKNLCENVCFTKLSWLSTHEDKHEQL